MLVDLIMFGGVFFWIVFGVAMIAMLSMTDNQDDGAITVFLISVAAFFALTKPPQIFLDWRLIVAYFGIGIVWWFFVFNIKLLKLKRYLDEDSRRVIDGTVNSVYLSREMLAIYDSEPSFEKFFSRCFCWPLNMIKFFFKDFMQEVWRVISNFAVLYKNRLLGVK